MALCKCKNKDRISVHTTLESGIFAKKTIGFRASYRNLVGVRTLALHWMFLVVHLSARADILHCALRHIF